MIICEWNVQFLIVWHSSLTLSVWFYFCISEKGKKKKQTHNTLVGSKPTLFSISIWFLKEKLIIGTENCTWGTGGVAAFENIILTFKMQIWSWTTQ